MFSFGQFCAGVSAAIAVKLTSSIDDVLWLSAFLTPNLSDKERGRNALTYAAVCLFQTCLAFVISTFGEVAVDAMMGNNGEEDDASKHMSSDRMFTLVAGSALLIYSIVLGVEYYNELYGEEEEDGAEYAPVRLSSSTDDSEETVTEQIIEQTTIEEGRISFGGQHHDAEMIISSTSNIHDTVDSPPDDDYDTDDVEITGISMVPMEIEDASDDESIGTDTTSKPSRSTSSSGPSDKQSRSLAVVAFLGSLDDLALFVPMLVGKAFGIVELIIGAMVSTLAIVVICIFLTRCRLVASALEKVPLVAIVAIFCTVLLIKGIFFMA